MFASRFRYRLHTISALLIAVTCMSCRAEPNKEREVVKASEESRDIAVSLETPNPSTSTTLPAVEKAATPEPAKGSVVLPNDANFVSTPFLAAPKPPESAKMEAIEIPNSRPLELVSCLTVNGQPVGYGTVFTENYFSVTKFSGNKLAGLRIKLIPPSALDRPVGALEIANVNAENKPVGPVYNVTPGILIGDPLIISEVNDEGKQHGQHLQISDDDTYFSTSFDNGERSENTFNSKSNHTLKTGERFFSNDRGPGRAHVGWHRTENDEMVRRGLYVDFGNPTWEISFYGPDGKKEGDTIMFMLTRAGSMIVIIAPERNRMSNGLGWKIHPGESIQYGEFAESIPTGRWLLYDKEIKVEAELTKFFAPLGEATITFNKDGKKKTVNVGAEGLGAHL